MGDEVAEIRSYKQSDCKFVISIDRYTVFHAHRLAALCSGIPLGHVGYSFYHFGIKQRVN